MEAKIALKKNQIEEICQNIETRFEENRNYRRNTETQWLKNLKAFSEGHSPKSLFHRGMRDYTNLCDITLPLAVRNAHASKVSALIGGELFRLQADGINVTDLQLTACVEAWLKQKLRRPESGFERNLSQALFQLECFNISAYQYSWVRQFKHKGQEQGELAYQGPRLDFVNIFNCYPDVLSDPTADLNELDLYYREIISPKDLLARTQGENRTEFLYKQAKPEKALEEVRGFKRSNFEREYNNAPSGKNNSAQKELLELRTVYLKRLEIGDLELKNVIAEYVKTETGQLIPWSLAFNHYDYNRKPIRFMVEWASPYDPYACGKQALAINHHHYLVFLKALRSNTAGRALMPSELIPTSLRAAFLGSDDEFDELYYKPGGQAFYNPDKLPPGKDKILRLSGSDKAIGDLQLISSEIEAVKEELQNLTIKPLSGIDLSSSTATGIRDLANRQDLAARSSLNAIAEQLIKPIVEFCLEDLQILLLDEQVNTSIPPSELESLIQERRELSPEQSSLVFKEHPTVGEPVLSLGVLYNTLTSQKAFKLSQGLLQGFRANVLIEMNLDDYSKPYELELFMGLYGNMIRNASNDTMRAYIAKIASEHLGRLSNNPKAAEINELMDGLLKMSLTPQPIDEAALVEKAAKVNESYARAENYKANALEKTLKSASI